MRVRAMRAGWNVPLAGTVSKYDIRHQPAWQDEGLPATVEGELVALKTEHGDVTLVDGKEADPATISPVSNAFCATGEGGGVDPTCGPAGKAARASATLHPYIAVFSDNAGTMPAPDKGRPTMHNPVIKYVELSKVFGTERGTNRAEVDAIKAHIKGGGKLPLIEVGWTPGEPGYFVIDGNHRYDALFELGAGKIPVNVYRRSFEE